MSGSFLLMGINAWGRLLAVRNHGGKFVLPEAVPAPTRNQS